jgi:nicotinamide mononucleotide transporter
VFYIIMQIQGWFLWSQGHKAADARIAIRRLSNSQWFRTLLLLLLGSAPLGYLMKQYTNAALPYVDAFTTVMSILAQWWMNKKYLENWVLWIIVDFIYLFQYSFKELYYTTGLYAAFLVLAVVGYREWKRTEFSVEKVMGTGEQ